jgi:hypothetical protein
VHLVRVDLAQPAVAHLVRVVHAQLVPVALRVLVSAGELRVRVARQLPAAVSLLVRAVAQAAVVVAESAAVLPEPSVRAAARAARPVSQSVRNAKSTNRDRHRALVERLFHAATATQ